MSWHFVEATRCSVSYSSLTIKPALRCVSPPPSLCLSARKSCGALLNVPQLYNLPLSAPEWSVLSLPLLWLLLWRLSSSLPPEPYSWEFSQCLWIYFFYKTLPVVDGVTFTQVETRERTDTAKITSRWVWVIKWLFGLTVIRRVSTLMARIGELAKCMLN